MFKEFLSILKQKVTDPDVLEAKFREGWWEYIDHLCEFEDFDIGCYDFDLTSLSIVGTKWYREGGWERVRIAAYGSLGKQLEMRYNDLKNGTDTFMDHCDAVRATWPKPDEIGE